MLRRRQAGWRNRGSNDARSLPMRLPSSTLAMLVGIAALAAPCAPRAAAAPGFPGTKALASGWQIQSSAIATDPGSVISQPAYSTAGWLPIHEPETLMAALVENGRYPDVLFSNNLASVPEDQFEVKWWYRDQLQLHPRPGQHTFLTVNGVLAAANLWVNGVKVADASQLQGAYSQLEYDVTPYVHAGANALALDVQPNDFG